MRCVTDFGTYEVNISRSTYRNNGNLAIILDSPTEGPFATLSVNLYDRLPKNQAYVDTNNCPWAIDFIREYELGKFTGITGRSGYCTYPLYEFDLSKLGED